MVKEDGMYLRVSVTCRGVGFAKANQSASGYEFPRCHQAAHLVALAKCPEEGEEVHHCCGSIYQYGLEMLACNTNVNHYISTVYLRFE